MATDPLTELVEPLVAARGLELYDIERHGNRIAVLVSGPEGIDVDALGDLSRVISVCLDDADPMPGAYTLEVSSPGVERRLRRPDHYQGAVGELVTVRTMPADDGRKRYLGDLVAADDTGFTVDDREVGTVTLRYHEVDKARTVFEWGPAPKPGARNGSRPKTDQRGPSR